MQWNTCETCGKEFVSQGSQVKCEHCLERSKIRRVILVGRHTGEIPGVEVVEQRNILWSTDARECDHQLSDLMRDARDVGAHVLLQNVPGILAMVMVRAAHESCGGYIWAASLGVVISVPGERKANVVKTFNVIDPDDTVTLVEAIQFTNGRAKVSCDDLCANVTVTVDPVPEFKFSHIEWLY